MGLRAIPQMQTRPLDRREESRRRAAQEIARSGYRIAACEVCRDSSHTPNSAPLSNGRGALSLCWRARDAWQNLLRGIFGGKFGDALFVAAFKIL
jgi:hypothetical protein